MDRATLQWLVLELPFPDHLEYEIHQHSDSELIEWLLRKAESGGVVFFKKKQTHYRPPSKPRKLIPASPPLQKTKPSARARIKEEQPEEADVTSFMTRKKATSWLLSTPKKQTPLPKPKACLRPLRKWRRFLMKNCLRNVLKNLPMR